MAFIAGAVIVWAALSKHPPQPRPPSVVDWPAWVQAVGSVAGIFAAALVARWQQKFSQRDQEAAEQREKIARYVRANRVLGRFLERIDQGIKQSERVEDTGFAVRIKKRLVPKELREFEGELHLIPGAGGPAMTAMDAFRRARKLLINKHVTSDNYHEYIREMRLARTNCAKAIGVLFAFLITLKE